LVYYDYGGPIMNNPYEKCPVFETVNFILRFVEKSDANDLLECYSDVNSQKLFNIDNFPTDCSFNTLDEMNRCIDFWIMEYQSQKYIRFSIMNKVTGKAIGTVEIFGGQYGVLRIDVKSEYEKTEYLEEIIGISINNFYELLNIDNIITKAIPEATYRINALKNNGFILYPKEMKPHRENYYIRENKLNI
jgi:RimJ/RimL family protein N-acetyltransferase